MAVTSTRVVGIGFTGDVNAPNQAYEAADNASSPGMIQTVALSSGFNSITCPTGKVAVTIIPPAGNTVTLTLKGITGDTGIGIHLTDPTSIGLATGQSTIGITTNNTVTVRLIWN